MVGKQVYSCLLAFTLNSESPSSPTIEDIKDSIENGFEPPPSVSSFLVLFSNASIAASRISFLLSFIAAFIKGPNTIFPNLLCAEESIEFNMCAIFRAARYFKLLCKSLKSSYRALHNSTNDYIQLGVEDMSSLHCKQALSTSSRAAFLIFHAVLPSLDP